MIKVAVCALCAGSMNEKVREGVGLRFGAEYGQSWVSGGQFNEEWKSNTKGIVAEARARSDDCESPSMHAASAMPDVTHSCSGVQGVVVPWPATNRKAGPEANAQNARSDCPVFAITSHNQGSHPGSRPRRKTSPCASDSACRLCRTAADAPVASTTNRTRTPGVS